jgi:hypothetical protein
MSWAFILTRPLLPHPEELLVLDLQGLSYTILTLNMALSLQLFDAEMPADTGTNYCTVITSVFRVATCWLQVTAICLTVFGFSSREIFLVFQMFPGLEYWLYHLHNG